VAKADAGIATLRDLTGKRVAVDAADVDAGEGPDRTGSFDLCHHLFALPWGRGQRGRVRRSVPTIRNYEGSQEKFLWTVESGKPGTAMAPFNGALTREEILEVYQYLTSLPRQ
jgi:hypothetical protein